MKLNTTARKRFRVSNKVKKVASEGRFRLSISRSSRNISAQIIDDKKNITLLAASSIEKDIKSKSKVNKSELSKIFKATQEKGLTCIPTKIFWKDNLIKLKISLGQGKTKFDKREIIKRNAPTAPIMIPTLSSDESTALTFIS